MDRVVDLVVYRAQKAFVPWGKCDGTSPWDGSELSNGYPCLDQVGRGKGSLIAGDSPLPRRWPGQLAEPTYAWRNTLNGRPSKMTTNSPKHIVEGRDFFNIPKPGYTPYIYPHPLTAGQ
jgi:hypothetical protein